jgi:hypothetical protein
MQSIVNNVRYWDFKVRAAVSSTLSTWQYNILLYLRFFRNKFETNTGFLYRLFNSSGGIWRILIRSRYPQKTWGILKYSLTSSRAYRFKAMLSVYGIEAISGWAIPSGQFLELTVNTYQWNVLLSRTSDKWLLPIPNTIYKISAIWDSFTVSSCGFSE